MKNKLNFSRIKKFIIICFTIYFAFLILGSEKAASGIKKGLSLSVKSLVPSLFPFMVLANFAALSDLKDFFSGIFGKLGEKLFRCPSKYSFVLIFSLLGGYPVGAQLINNMYETGEISIGEAEKLLCFCVNCSPAFIINAIGIGILKNAKAGLIIWISEVLAALTTANFVRVKNSGKEKIKQEKNINSYTNAFTESVEKSTVSMLKICGFTSVFVAAEYVLSDLRWIKLFFNFIYDKFFVNFMYREFFDKLCKGIFEINSGIFFGENNIEFMGLFTFLTAFGGIAVFFQIRSITNKNISLKPFVISRFFMGFYSAFLSEILKKKFIPEAVSTMVGEGVKIYINSNCVIYTMCMLSMISMIFLSDYKFSERIYNNI